MDWAEGLALPTRFSTPTTKAVETGVLTKSARVEIVHSVATLMLMHTTPHDLDTISRRLIEKHPKLRDTVDKGYVSTFMPNIICVMRRDLGEVNYAQSLRICAVLTVHRKQVSQCLLHQREQRFPAQLQHHHLHLILLNMTGMLAFSSGPSCQRSGRWLAC